MRGTLQHMHEAPPVPVCDVWALELTTNEPVNADALSNTLNTHQISSDVEVLSDHRVLVTLYNVRYSTIVVVQQTLSGLGSLQKLDPVTQ